MVTTMSMTTVITTTGMTTSTRLLQLASPALPVGAYSYSQGLESAVEAGIVHDAASALAWIEDLLMLSVARMDAPLFLLLFADPEFNEMLLASRESAELRAETVQMGYSLNRLLPELGLEPLGCQEPSFPAVFAHAARQWGIAPDEALTAYLFSWLENQVMAAVKAVPLGQTDGQKMLLHLGGRVGDIVRQARAMPEGALGNFAPGLAILSAKHETQYSRLFRS